MATLTSARIALLQRPLPLCYRRTNCFRYTRAPLVEIYSNHERIALHRNKTLWLYLIDKEHMASTHWVSLKVTGQFRICS